MSTYRRFSTRLRFEPGQPLPSVGASWDGRTELGRIAVRVHLLRINRVGEHPDEPGVMLMDCRVSTSRLPAEGGVRR